METNLIGIKMDDEEILQMVADGELDLDDAIELNG